jgi:hypothetical protein
MTYARESSILLIMKNNQKNANNLCPANIWLFLTVHMAKKAAPAIPLQPNSPDLIITREIWP